MDEETAVIGEVVNVRCIEQALLNQKKKYQRVIMRQREKIAELNSILEKLYSKFKSLQDMNEKQHNELCDQKKEILEIAKILKTHGQEIKSKFKKVLKEMINLPADDTKYLAVSGVPAIHCVRVYKTLEERHSDLALRFLGLNDKGCNDSLPLIDTFKYMPRMFKVSLDIIHALADYTNKSWGTATKAE